MKKKHCSCFFFCLAITVVSAVAVLFIVLLLFLGIAVIATPFSSLLLLLGRQLRMRFL